ncbi:MAG: acyl-CoA dehydrogenase family protein [Sphingopyxis sp.]|uniref:acyl-CoA dehydrogenase family protein n=1 Tax=Sphingopyxis sp. TaxID=1908224 RepID=UPI002AB96D3C|nr:acyl-CoA dehydrogenase family protein [Sphingopyxis sp.]MDZ3830891.1 acyl-CoA dehydrogenase family protein [Sphingopyxis sp.]
MNFDLDEDQQLTRDTIGRFLGQVDIAVRHAMRKADGGYPRTRWQEVADLGLLALAAPQVMGGMGGTMVDLVLAAEALGRGIAIDPWLENGVLPIRLAAATGDAGLVGDLLTGAQLAAVGFAEPTRRYENKAVGTKAEGNQIAGAKTFVLGAPIADTLLITVADNKLARIAKDAIGVVRQDYPVIDGSYAATLDLRRAPADLLELPEAMFQRVVGDVRLLAAAEMVGLAQTMFDDTLAYVGEREQFGAAIGSFQALQHRLVECYAALEQARSMILRTAMLDPTSDDAGWPRIAAGAKAFVGEAAMRIGLEAVQMHGGMGQTDELAIGHALKRVMLLDKFLGDQDHCLRSFARAA